MVWAAPAYVSLIGLGAHGFVLRNQLLLAAGNATGAFVLVPLLGATGVLWGLIAAALLNAVLLWRQIRVRIDGFRGFVWLCSRRAARLTLALALMAACWAVHQFGAQPPWALLLVSAPVLALLSREPPVRYVADRLRGERT
jgi:peptidoglycan biosynthesis protein MviN/MurJ (putative lipid II flippase)